MKLNLIILHPLCYFDLSGKSFLGMEGAHPEFLALTAELQRGVVRMRDQSLQSPLAQKIVKRLLGVESEETLTLNTKETLENFIKNADTNSPTNIRELLNFKNATRIPQWQALLSE